MFIRPKEELWTGATWQGSASGARSLVAVSSTRGHPACWGAISPSFPFCYCFNLPLGFSQFVSCIITNKQSLIPWGFNDACERWYFNIAGFDKTFNHTGYFTLFIFIQLYLFCIQNIPGAFKFSVQMVLSTVLVLMHIILLQTEWIDFL